VRSLNWFRQDNFDIPVQATSDLVKLLKRYVKMLLPNVMVEIFRKRKLLEKQKKVKNVWDLLGMLKFLKKLLCFEIEINFFLENNIE
jgi:translation elongation factor EF-4